MSAISADKRAANLAKFSRILSPSRGTLFLSFSAAIITLIFVYLTGLITKWGAWYSVHLPYRLQVEAFFQGKLSLGPTPYSLLPDFHWGSNAQQGWGLGVPLLRTPFDLAAKFFGYNMFPDRIVLVIYHFAVTLLFIRTIHTILSIFVMSPVSRYLTSILLASAFTLRPELVNLVSGRFLIYEECVTYAQLWATALISLIILGYFRNSVRILFAAAIVGSIGAWIRPTAFLYTVPSALIITYLVLKGGGRPWLSLIGLILIWTLPIFLLLYVNNLRFGHPLEFGYSLNMTRIPLNAYALRFDYPCKYEGLHRAMLELVTALFLLKRGNGGDYYRESIDPWFSETLRFREFYFSGFRAVDLFFVLFGLLLVGGMIMRRASSDEWIKRVPRGVPMLLIFGLLSFLLHFIFYLRSPSLTSRYIIDFSASITAIELALLFLLAGYFSKVSLLSLSVLWGAAMLYNSLFPNFNHIYKGYVNLQGKSLERLRVPLNYYYPPQLQAEYICPLPPQSKLCALCVGGISQDCRVSVVSSIFLPPAECLEIEYKSEIPPSFTPRVKSDLEELLAVSVSQENNITRRVYCTRYKYNQLNPWARLVSIAWTGIDDLRSFDAKKPITLIRVANQAF